MRVRWTDDERKVLIDSAASLLHTKEVFSIRESLIKAQLSLAKDRRREIAALSQVPWFTDGVPIKLKELERVAAKTAEQQLEAAVSATAQQAREEFEDQISNYIGKILGKALRIAIQDLRLQPEELSQPLTHIRRSLHAAHKERLPRVIIAGMLNSQAKSVEAAFKDKLDIRFWSKDQSTDTLKSMLQHADSAIGMVSFLSHAHDAVLKSSKVPYTPVSGGVTQIKSALEKLLEPA